MTERFTWTMGTAGILRIFDRSDCDCVTRTYLCLFVAPNKDEQRWAEPLVIGPTNDRSQTFISRYCFFVITFTPFECLRQINSSLCYFPLQVELVYTALCNH
jgi:hypothetical protein